jgi:hypothetical protein
LVFLGSVFAFIYLIIIRVSKIAEIKQGLEGLRGCPVLSVGLVARAPLALPPPRLPFFITFIIRIV